MCLRHLLCVVALTLEAGNVVGNMTSLINATSSIIIASTVHYNANIVDNLNSNNTNYTGNFTANFTANSTANSTANFTVNATTTSMPVFDNSTTCIGKDVWNPEVYFDKMKCMTPDCAKSLLDTLVLYITCNSWAKPKEPQIICQRIVEYLLSRASHLKSAFATDPLITSQYKEEFTYPYFKSEHGFLKKKFFSTAQPIVLGISGEEQFYLPVTELELDVNPYQFTIFSTNIVEEDSSVGYAIERTALRQTFQNLGESELLKINGKQFRLNSKIVSFTFYPSKEVNGDFNQILIYLKDYKTTTNHKCVKLVNGLGTGYWTDEGCHATFASLNRLKCRCDEIEGMFAIVSELQREDPAAPEIPRTIISTGLTVVCYVGIIFSIFSIVLPYAAKCNHLGGLIRVYRFADFTHALEFVLVLVGMEVSSDIKMSKVIATLIHFLHHSVMMWFVSEGVHLLHGISPLYDNKMGMMFFYSTLSFGVPAALAGAAAGYDYPFNGTTQYIWVYSRGPDMLYFIVPTIGILAIMIAIDGFLVYDLFSWIGSKEDYLYVRSKKFVQRSIGFAIVFPVTQLLGLSSMQGNGEGYSAYLTMGFLGIQAIQMFYFHFIANFEVWGYRSEMQRLAEEKENEEKKANENEESDSDDEDDEDEKKENRAVSDSSFQHVDVDTGASLPSLKSPVQTGSRAELIPNT